MATIHLTKGSFLRRVADYENNPQEWKFLGDKPAVIDFYASWCGPCKALAPKLEEIAQEYIGKVDIYKVDVDAEEELASFFKIRTIPTLLFIPKNGTPQMTSGVLSKVQLQNIINDTLL